MLDGILLWGGFGVLVAGLLALDLGVFNRKDHVFSVKEGLLWSLVWTAVAVVFNVGLFIWDGSEKGMQFFAGYLIERSLSFDNIFVFLMILTYFQVPRTYHNKVLFWGILVALAMRTVLIVAGISLIAAFEWVIYLLGGFLIFTAIKMIQERGKEIEPEKNPVLRVFRRLMPVCEQYEGGNCFIRRNGTLMATPLLVVLLAIGTTDFVFALDSIPAVLAVSSDPFVVYTSNVFALLGLRALFFAVAGMMSLFRFLDYGLSAVLVFVGSKMILADVYHMPIGVALGGVALILTIAVVASILMPRKPEPAEELALLLGKVVKWGGNWQELFPAGGASAQLEQSGD